MKKIVVFLIGVLLVFGVEAAERGRDTLAPKIGGDTLKMMESIVKKPHSPHRATIMAMILPGSGQIYNGQWWKVPILYGGIAADLYGIIWNQKRFKEYRDAYVEWVNHLDKLSKNPDTPYPDRPAWDKIPKSFDVQQYVLGNSQREKWFSDILSNRKTSFKRNRDLCYIVMAAIYAINIIDATVYAHFYDFEIDDKLSLHWQPSAGFSPVSGGSLGLTLTLNF